MIKELNILNDIIKQKSQLTYRIDKYGYEWYINDTLIGLTNEDGIVYIINTENNSKINFIDKNLMVHNYLLTFIENQNQLFNSIFDLMDETEVNNENIINESESENVINCIDVETQEVVEPHHNIDIEFNRTRKNIDTNKKYLFKHKHTGKLLYGNVNELHRKIGNKSVADICKIIYPDLYVVTNKHTSIYGYEYVKETLNKPFVFHNKKTDEVFSGIPKYKALKDCELIYDINTHPSEVNRIHYLYNKENDTIVYGVIDELVKNIDVGIRKIVYPKMYKSKNYSIKGHIYIGQQNDYIDNQIQLMIVS